MAWATAFERTRAATDKARRHREHDKQHARGAGDAALPSTRPLHPAPSLSIISPRFVQGPAGPHRHKGTTVGSPSRCGSTRARTTSTTASSVNERLTTANEHLDLPQHPSSKQCPRHTPYTHLQRPGVPTILTPREERRGARGLVTSQCGGVRRCRSLCRRMGHIDSTSTRRRRHSASGSGRCGGRRRRRRHSGS